MKIARTVWSRGKDRDNFKILPIAIKTFKKTANNCYKYLDKGSLVSVTASIRTGSYMKDTKKIYTMEVVAEDVRFLDTKKSINENSDGEHNQNNQSHDDDPFPGSVETDEEWPF